MKFSVTFVKKPLQVGVMSDWKVLIDVNFFFHVQPRAESQNRGLQIIYDRHHLVLFFRKHFVPLGLQLRGMNADPSIPLDRYSVSCEIKRTTLHISKLNEITSRPTLSQYSSFKIHRTTFLNYTKSADL